MDMRFHIEIAVFSSSKDCDTAFICISGVWSAFVSMHTHICTHHYLQHTRTHAYTFMNAHSSWSVVRRRSKIDIKSKQNKKTGQTTTFSKIRWKYEWLSKTDREKNTFSFFIHMWVCVCVKLVAVKRLKMIIFSGRCWNGAVQSSWSKKEIHTPKRNINSI